MIVICHLHRRRPVIINSLKHLPDTTRDAAFGLIGLAFLYITRFILNRVERNAKSPGVRRVAFFANTFRTAFLVIFETVFAWVYLRHKNPKKFSISILGTVCVLLARFSSSSPADPH
ncbi:hypothetical protein NBRC10513_008175 [Rhodotorula toruloides]